MLCELICLIPSCEQLDIDPPTDATSEANRINKAFVCATLSDACSLVEQLRHWIRCLLNSNGTQERECVAQTVSQIYIMDHIAHGNSQINQSFPI